MTAILKNIVEVLYGFNQKFSSDNRRLTWLFFLCFFAGLHYVYEEVYAFCQCYFILYFVLLQNVSFWTDYSLISTHEVSIILRF